MDKHSGISQNSVVENVVRVRQRSANENLMNNLVHNVLHTVHTILFKCYIDLSEETLLNYGGIISWTCKISTYSVCLERG